jgi:hypothetical protein
MGLHSTAEVEAGHLPGFFVCVFGLPLNLKLH